jgi:hypothetical protein
MLIMKTSLVSIIIPTFNSEKFILETIQSVQIKPMKTGTYFSRWLFVRQYCGYYFRNGWKDDRYTFFSAWKKCGTGVAKIKDK